MLFSSKALVEGAMAKPEVFQGDCPEAMVADFGGVVLEEDDGCSNVLFLGLIWL
jgi:hypothetical protein